MELRQYIAILRRRLWIIVGTTLLLTLLAGLLSYLATPIYRASTTVRVATVGGGLSGRYPDILYSTRLMNTYSLIVTADNTTRTIMDELQLTEAPSIEVEVVPNTELLNIYAEATSPQVVKDVADAAARILMQESRELYAGGGQSTVDILNRQIAQIETELVALRSEYEQQLASDGVNAPEAEAVAKSIEFKERSYNSLLDQYETVRLNAAFLDNAVTVVEPATVPAGPAKPRRLLNILLGLILGLMGGVVLALIRENLDNRLYTPGQIEAITKAPTIGYIPGVAERVGVLGLNGSYGQQPQVEAFRRLRINLLSMVPDGQPYAILVTSASEGEGKSTIVANLAVSIAKSGRSVALVDCDMHAPSLHQLFDVSNHSGLTTFLTKQAGVSGILQETKLNNLKIVASGPVLPEPEPMGGTAHLTPSGLAERLRHGTELLGSVQMRALLNELTEQFDIVLLDTPALNTVTDAAVLVPYADHILLVVAQSKANRDAVSSAREQLATMNARSLSVVINRVIPDRA